MERDYFESSEHRRFVQNQWNRMSLQYVIENNPGKQLTECLEIMLRELQKLYYGLHHDLRNDTYYHNKLVDATRSHPACQYATAKPASTPGALILDLRSSVAQYQDMQRTSTVNVTEQAAGTHYTDRRFYNSRSRSRDNFKRRPARGNMPPRRQVCYVCDKPLSVCGSWNHSKEEKAEALRRRSRMKAEARQFLADNASDTSEEPDYDSEPTKHI